MADNEKSKQKPKSSFFGAKGSGKKESKTKPTKNQRKLQKVGSRGSSSENISENLKETEATANLTEASTSNTNLASSCSNENISKAEEVGDSSTVNGVVENENLETNSELTLTNEQFVSEEATKERDASIQSNGNAEVLSAKDEQENSSKPETNGTSEDFEVPKEQIELQDIYRDKQIESDEENKANEITTGDCSKKHGKAASGPLASFRRHKKKNKLSKLSQDAESIEKPDGNQSDKKEISSEHPVMTEDETAISDQSEPKKEVEIEELKDAGLSQEKNSATADKMVNEKSKEHQATKKGHKEKKSGPFASFRKNKKKADLAKQQSTSTNIEAKSEDTTEPQETSKENAADNIPQPDEENAVEVDKEMTEKQQSNASEEQQKKESDSIPALNAAEEQAIVNDESCNEEKKVENKPKRTKRFGSFSGFSRTKKAPKLSQQLSFETDVEEKNTTESSTQEQAEPTSDLTSNIHAEEVREENKSEEQETAEICKDEPGGSETQVPEVSTGSGNEDINQQQEGLGTNKEKKKSGLKRRISKIKLHSSKSKDNKAKDNQGKESAQNQPEADLQEKKQEAGTDKSEVSQQVKRRKSLQEKISKALKRNKSEQLELNELRDNPSASEDEEDCQPSLNDKNPIAPSASEENQPSFNKAPSATESKEEMTETDGKKEETPLKQVQEIVPEIVEVFGKKEEKPSDEQNSSSISGSAEVVKRVTFVLDEEKQAEEPKTSQEQSEIKISDSESETTKNNQETEQVALCDKDGVTLNEESESTENNEETEQVALRDKNGVTLNGESESTENNQETEQVASCDKDGLTPNEKSETNENNQEIKQDASHDKDGMTLNEEDDMMIDKVDGVFKVCRNIMKQVSNELHMHIKARENAHQESADNQEQKPNEDLPKLMINDAQPREAVFLEIQEEDSGNLTESSEALSDESLESTGTVVMLESSSDLESVSPMPDVIMPISKSLEGSAEENPVEQNIKNQMTVNEVKVTEKTDEKNTQDEQPTEIPGLSGQASNSEETQHENEEHGEVDRTAETDVEYSMDRNLEKSLERSLDSSLQCFLSQSLKEEWIVVRSRLEISQEMSYQFKALALESYAHRPACCKIM